MAFDFLTVSNSKFSEIRKFSKTEIPGGFFKNPRGRFLFESFGTPYLLTSCTLAELELSLLPHTSHSDE